jgi:hypothetical protein
MPSNGRYSPNQSHCPFEQVPPLEEHFFFGMRIVWLVRVPIEPYVDYDLALRNKP